MHSNSILHIHIYSNMPSARSALGLTLLAYASSVAALAARIPGTYEIYATANYTLVDNYTSSNFFNDFTLLPAPTPPTVS